MIQEPKNESTTFCRGFLFSEIHYLEEEELNQNSKQSRAEKVAKKLIASSVVCLTAKGLRLRAGFSTDESALVMLDSAETAGLLEKRGEGLDAVYFNHRKETRRIGKTATATA